MTHCPIHCNLNVLRSANLVRSEQFHSALGMKFLRHTHGTGPIHLACELLGLTFEIYPCSSSSQSSRATRFGLSVGMVEHASGHLIAAGGQSISPPQPSPWGKRAVVADLDGHRGELTELETLESPERGFLSVSTTCSLEQNTEAFADHSANHLGIPCSKSRYETRNCVLSRIITRIIT